MLVQLEGDPAGWPRQMLKELRDSITNLEGEVEAVQARLEQKTAWLQAARDAEQRFAAIVEQLEQAAR